MALMYDIDIGSTYDFTLYGSAIIGSGFSAAKVVGILDYSSAMQLADIAATHAQILPELPAGTPSDPSVLIYVKIITSTGAVRVVALNWISSQPTIVTSTTFVVTIYDSALSKLPEVQAMLRANGFVNFNITTS
jgi:hypothetical protein